MARHWLIKAEPESRIVKGIDVKFSVDDFEDVGVSAWDGVRNRQANKFLRDEMKHGDTCLFYQSNCKNPGIIARCTVVKEGYPDHNAWDKKHPYYDAKSDPDKPTWFMVNVRFDARLERLVPLTVIKDVAKGAIKLPYLANEDVKAIQDGSLLRQSRLSVQPVTQRAYDVYLAMADKGGWDTKE